MQNWFSKLFEEIERNPLNGLPLSLFVVMVVTFVICLFLFPGKGRVFWFSLIFGIGTAVYTFCFAILWAGSGNFFVGIEFFLTRGWEEPLLKILLIFLPPTGWLNLIGGMILLLGKPRPMGVASLSSIGMIFLGMMSTIAIMVGIIVGPSGL